MENTQENNLYWVAETLYKEQNPNTRMDVPSSVYETVKRWRDEWSQSGSELTFYAWCKENKQPAEK